MSPYFERIRTSTLRRLSVASASFSPTPNLPITFVGFFNFSWFSFWVRCSYLSPRPKSRTCQTPCPSFEMSTSLVPVRTCSSSALAMISRTAWQVSHLRESSRCSDRICAHLNLACCALHRAPILAQTWNSFLWMCPDMRSLRRALARRRRNARQMIYGVSAAVCGLVADSASGSSTGDGFVLPPGFASGCFGSSGTTSNVIVGSVGRMCPGMIVSVPKIKA